MAAAMLQPPSEPKSRGKEVVLRQLHSFLHFPIQFRRVTELTPASPRPSIGAQRSAIFRVVMSVFSIRHVTTYHYHQPVEFGAHRMMLRPRDDDDQKVIDAEIEITPKPKQLAWTLDAFGNHVAIARFADRAAELRFVSNIRLDHTPARFHGTEIKEFARTYPFSYVAEDRSSLESFIVPLSRQPEIDRWAHDFFARMVPPTCTNCSSTYGHHQADLQARSRHKKGVRDPFETLHLGSGSCRDLAMFMMRCTALRGIAARFVSGYLHLPDDGDDDDAAGGNTHAWVQVYVPGPGWVDFDPSGGGVGNENLHPRRGRASPSGGNPPARHMVRDGGGSLGHECRSKVKAAAAPTSKVAQCLDDGSLRGDLVLFWRHFICPDAKLRQRPWPESMG